MGKKFDMAALVKESLGDVNVSKVDTVRMIPVELIDPNPKNFYEMSDLEELAGSIEAWGLVHPIKVSPVDGRYVITDGERRFRATKEILGRTEIQCIVSAQVNTLLEEMQLIEANRTQRKMSAADLSKQAERYTELLAQLKEAGVAIPGRLRDRVAEALQVSSTKLARLHAIRENLDSRLLDKFDRGVINESVAYEFSRRPKAFQESAGRYPDEHLSQFTAENAMRLYRTWENSLEGKKALGVKPKVVSESSTATSWDAEAYMSQRRQEDEDFYLMLGLEADHFLAQLTYVTSRQDGIQTLKEHFGRDHSGWYYDEVQVHCSMKGVELGCEDRAIPFIERTWTDVYDMLCRHVLAAGARQSRVSKVDHAPAGLEWHDTQVDGPPPADARNVVCWGVFGHELYKPLSSMLEKEFELNGHTLCRYWAVVEGPKEEET